MLARAALAGALLRAQGVAPGDQFFRALAQAALGALADPEPPQKRDRRFIDRLEVAVHPGAGGAGAGLPPAAAPGRGRGRGRGGAGAAAGGGHGGPGGAVVFVADGGVRDLGHVPRLLRAAPGAPGGRARAAGAAGRDLVVRVPLGTAVTRLPPRRGSLARAGAPDGGAGEEEVDWARRWRPWDGARDYRAGGGSSSDGESSSSSDADDADEEETSDAGGGASSDSGSDGGGGAAAPAGGGGVLLADLAAPGQRLVVPGGAGGRGAAPAAPVRRPSGAPYAALAAALAARDAAAAAARAGRPAPDAGARLRLDLRVLCDVGLVGPPSVGKSSLLRALTAAAPRVGAYPFTTLGPQLGVLRWPPAAAASGAGPGGEPSPRFLAPPPPAHPPVVLADVPGVIAGAAAGRGLGLRFLRHLERCRALLFVVDLSAETLVGVRGGRDAAARGGDDEDEGEGEGEGALGDQQQQLWRRGWRQLRVVRAELAAHSPALAAKPWGVVVNKCDGGGGEGGGGPAAWGHGGAAAVAALARRAAAAGGAGAVAASALRGRGLADVRALVARLVAAADDAGGAEVEEEREHAAGL